MVFVHCFLTFNYLLAIKSSSNMFAKSVFCRFKYIHMVKNNLIYYKKLSSQTEAQNRRLRKTLNSYKMVAEEDVKMFNYYSNVVIRELTTTDLITSDPKTRNYLKDIFEYNMTGGSQFRSFLLLAVYKYLMKEDYYKSKNLESAYILAICFEILHGSFLIIDDIADNSTTRRGKECWHKIVGPSAINDSNAYFFFVYSFLKKYIGSHKNFEKIQQCFIEGSAKTFIGQIQDSFSFNPGDGIIRYHETVDHKTGSYTFYKPFLIGLYLSKRDNNIVIENSKELFLELGRIFQIHNDYLDVFGEQYSGKKGTDIENGKNTWLIIKAYENANEDQRKILNENYGLNNPNAVLKVKKIFEEVQIPELVKQRETEGYAKVLNLLENIENESDKLLLKFIVHKIKSCTS